MTIFDLVISPNLFLVGLDTEFIQRSLLSPCGLINLRRVGLLRSRGLYQGKINSQSGPEHPPIIFYPFYQPPHNGKEGSVSLFPTLSAIYHSREPAKSRTIAVRLISMAMTGYYRTLRRPRTSRPLSMLKYDPVGMVNLIQQVGKKAITDLGK